MAALVAVIVVGVFSVPILLLQQQASANILLLLLATTNVGGDIVTCTHSEKTPNHPTRAHFHNSCLKFYTPNKL